MQNSSIIADIKKTLIVPCCNNCSDGGHITSFHTLKSKCLICGLSTIHSREMDMKELLKHNIFYYDAIVRKLGELFNSIVESFSYHGIRFRSSGLKKRRSRIDWLKNGVSWGRLDIHTRAEIQSGLYISRPLAHNLINKYHR